ncbi:hypothetical protein AGMMS49949_07080 [Alphaproteobacteria bacterium]|nr:hypothetical protein AGMMS49949_07080 [Alphaproteobacteria bacterium]GHS98962.1 hypothetical protein AGMMS50296_6880 [Alphaproteobacteria bacterium]
MEQPPVTPRSALHTRPKSQGCFLVGKSLKPVVAPIYKKNGIFYAEIFLNWSHIVGERYSRLCRPVRITGDKPNATLYVGASRAVAAEMFYSVPTLLERIHHYFGFQILESMRFVNDFSSPHMASTFSPKKEEAAPQNSEEADASWKGDDITYPPLREALMRFQSYMRKIK